MYLLAIMHKPQPVRKSMIFFICTILNPTIVNLTTTTKTTLNRLLQKEFGQTIPLLINE